MRWAEHVEYTGEECVQGFDGKARMKETRMGLRETGWGSVHWIQLAQDRDRWQALVNMVMNLQVLAPLG
jgi:hypothetical protein